MTTDNTPARSLNDREQFQVLAFRKIIAVTSAAPSMTEQQLGVAMGRIQEIAETELAARYPAPSPAGAGELPPLVDEAMRLSDLYAENLLRNANAQACSVRDQLRALLQTHAALASASQEQAALTLVTKTAPRVIYLQVFDSATEAEGRPFPVSREDITWSPDEVFDVDVKYIRADLAAKPLERLEQGDAVAWQAKSKDNGTWGPPVTSKRMADSLAGDGFEIRSLVVATPPQPRSEPTPALPQAGLDALSEVTRLLREEGVYVDEEGEATRDLSDLLRALSSTPRSEGGDDAGCICKGNWRSIVKEYEPLIGAVFVTASGEELTFFGIVNGGDDYYYGMSLGGRLQLLSCVGSIAGYGLATKAKGASK